jgi:hypothetical protein
LITSEAAVHFVKLSGFGYDQVRDGKTTQHVAPEALASSQCTLASDCFALGSVSQQTLPENAPAEVKCLLEQLQDPLPLARPTAQHALFVIDGISSNSVVLKPWPYVADVAVVGHHYTSLIDGFGSMQAANKTRADLHHVALEAVVCNDQHAVIPWLELCKLVSTLRHPHLLPIISMTRLASPSHPNTTLDAVVYPQGATLLQVASQYTTSELRRMVCVDVLLGLEFLAARQIFVTMMSTAQCRVLDGRCQLVILTRDCSSTQAVVVAFQQFLLSCQQELALVNDSVIQCLTNNAPSTSVTVGSKANPVSLLVIKAQSLCLDDVEWELPFTSLEFVSRLGQGQFGDVSLMRLIQPASSPNSTESHRTTRFVAVKRLLDPSCQAEFEQELTMMSQMHHPNLVSLLWIVSKPSCLALEFLDGGSLEDWLATSNGKAAANSQKQRIACSVAAGMAELARLNIVHRDLAARNVLVSVDASIVKVGKSRLCVSSSFHSGLLFLGQ